MYPEHTGHLPAERAVTIHQPAPLAPYDLAAPVAMDPYAERQPVVWVPDAYGRMVPMPKHLAPPPAVASEPRDLTPLPLLDPVAQRLMGAGIGGGALSAGAGYGISEVINAAAGFSGGALIWIALVVLALRTPARAITSGKGSTVNIRKAVIKRSHFHG
ncbi:hypothetical protein [Streptomyces olivochromogenes]|uniref:Uncharacterized protein n=1 Tax=Streptomyces olivochromogenes TaxID=1963 RepID=A0A250VEG8_STROL|nr:hypothetical protein [Streptomyces olivochromogenes]KUN46911.1 hypothetical protein AQJ27_14160 [Streptomyces olivochromogenes]GAX52400.1 hypothetical protein SO3561_03914 [Streptomyces olivochromogenes]